MKLRIRRKVYKRAQSKLDATRKPRDRRDYFEQIKDTPTLLTGLEKRVFIKKQLRMCRTADSIIAELKAEGNW